MRRGVEVPSSVSKLCIEMDEGSEERRFSVSGMFETPANMVKEKVAGLKGSLGNINSESVSKAVKKARRRAQREEMKAEGLLDI